MRAIREEANRQFAGQYADVSQMSPEEVARWLHDHRDAEARAREILAAAAERRRAVYDEFTAERARLERVYASGGMGKTGYVFIGDVEYDAKRRPLEAWHAGLRNLVGLGWVTGHEPSKLEDFLPLGLAGPHPPRASSRLHGRSVGSHPRPGRARRELPGPLQQPVAWQSAQARHAFGANDGPLTPDAFPESLPHGMGAVAQESLGGRRYAVSPVRWHHAHPVCRFAALGDQENLETSRRAVAPPTQPPRLSTPSRDANSSALESAAGPTPRDCSRRRARPSHRG